MSRQFGLTARSVVGGFDQPSGPHFAHDTQRDSILVPTDLPLPRSNFLQAVFDVLALLSAMLLVSATGCGLAFAVFVLLFVRL